MSKYGWLIFFLLGNVAWSQEARATIGGRVTDAQGAAVPNAVVVVIDDDTGVKQQTRTNTQGNWTVQFFLPGHYQFTVTAPGFKTENRQGFTLQTADNKQIDIQLEVGSSSQSVEVTAEAPLIDTTSATSGTPCAVVAVAMISSTKALIYPSLFAGHLTLSQGNVQMD